MKSAFVTSALVFGTAALAGYGDQVNSYSGQLTQQEANTIVAKYAAVLQGQGYEGMTIDETAADVVAPNYVEVSDSILSLEGRPLGGSAANSEEEWYQGVSRNPSPGIITHEVLVAGGCNVLWYWTFPHVGSGQYPVKGFNLLRIDGNKQIYEADIEFNSIAWGLDTQQLKQYCS